MIPLGSVDEAPSARGEVPRHRQRQIGPDAQTRTAPASMSIAADVRFPALTFARVPKLQVDQLARSAFAPRWTC